MNGLLRTLAGALLAITLGAHAVPIALPAGLSLDPPAALDVTYQIVPAYDEKEKVVAGWTGDTLDFFLTLDNLPPGHLDGKAYLAALARDLRESWGGIELGRQGRYRIDGRFDTTFVELRSPAKAGSRGATMFAHHLSDGKAAYVAMATVVDPATPESVLERSLQLLQTARISGPPVPAAQRQSNESPFFGKWVAQDKLPDGTPLDARIELKPDLSFRAEASAQGRTRFAATGAWSRQGDALHWTYLDSNPALPADKRTDEDVIVSVDADTLVLKSRLSGKTRQYRRVP